MIDAAASGRQRASTVKARARKEGLAARDATFELGVQRYSSEEITPVEDSSKAWPTPWERVALLVIPRQDLDTPTLKLLQRTWQCLEALPETFDPVIEREERRGGSSRSR